MRRLLAMLHLWIKWAEKGFTAAGIEHTVVSVQTGLLTFLNINTLQAFLGFKPFISYTNGLTYYLVYIFVTLLFFKLFLPKSFLLNQEFSAAELKTAKFSLIIYFILTISLTVVSSIYFRQQSTGHF